MDKSTIEKYAPYAVVVVFLLFQWNLFVTPLQLEETHREILNEIAEKYTTKEQSGDLKAQLNDIQNKIDRIYDKLITKP